MFTDASKLTNADAHTYWCVYTNMIEIDVRSSPSLVSKGYRKNIGSVKNRFMDGL